MNTVKMSLAQILFDRIPFTKTVWNMVKGLDLAVLLLYLFIVHSDATALYLPKMDTDIIFVSFLVFFFSIVLTLSISGYFIYKKSLNLNCDESSLSKILALIGIITGVPIVISITMAIVNNYGFVETGGSFGLRVISTSLHKLVPFESRWIFLIGFPIILTNVRSGARNWLMFVNIAILFFILFVTQTKMNYLIIFSILLVWVLTQRTYTLKAAVSIFLIFGLFSFFGLKQIISNAPQNVENLLSNKQVFRITDNDWNNTQPTRLCDGFKMQGDSGLVQNSDPIQNGNSRPSAKGPKRFKNFKAARVESPMFSSLKYRLFNTSARVTRVFYCLREVAGWKPEFKGHQSFRIIGGYKPVYRWIMNSVDREHGATAVTSAVANVVADSFLNGGLIAVGISAVFTGIVWLLLFKLSSSPMFFYLRILFCLTLCTQGILTAMVIAVFVFLICVAQFLLKRTPFAVWIRSF